MASSLDRPAYHRASTRVAPARWWPRLEYGAAAGTWRVVIGGALLVALAKGLAVVRWREPSLPAGPNTAASAVTWSKCANFSNLLHHPLGLDGR